MAAGTPKRRETIPARDRSPALDQVSLPARDRSPALDQVSLSGADSLRGMRSPLLDLPGAVAATGPDADVAGHYGDLFAEQRALLSGAAVVDRSNREIVRVSGVDRLKWLNDLTTQKLDNLAPGVWTQALVLDIKGRVEHHLKLIDDGTAVLAHVEPGASAGL